MSSALARRFVAVFLGAAAFASGFFAVVFFFPEGGGYFLEKPNFEVANALKTPAHIAPVWYYMPYYAMLRATPSMFGSALPGVIVMFGAIAILFVLPWLDRSPVRSIRYKGMLSKIALAIFVVSFLILGYLGGVTSTPTGTIVGRICTILYFLYFLLMPLYTSIEKCKQPPERVTGGH